MIGRVFELRKDAGWIIAGTRVMVQWQHGINITVERLEKVDPRDPVPWWPIKHGHETTIANLKPLPRACHRDSRDS